MTNCGPTSTTSASCSGRVSPFPAAWSQAHSSIRRVVAPRRPPISDHVTRRQASAGTSGSTVPHGLPAHVFDDVRSAARNAHAFRSGAWARCARGLGRKHALHIAGKDVETRRLQGQAQPDRSRLVAGLVRPGRASQHVDQRDARRERCVSALARDAAARKESACCAGSRQLIEERVYHIAAAVTLEVGKNRMEALGEVQETADFFNVYCDRLRAPGRIRSRAAERSAAERRVAQPQRDEAVRRVGRHQSVQLFRSRSQAARWRRRSSPATRSCSRARAKRRGPAACWPTACAMPDCRPGVFNYLMGPGGAIGDALVDASADQRHHVHRLL